MLVSEALGVVIKLHVPEIVSEAGPEVCSVMVSASAFLITDNLGYQCARHRDEGPDEPGQARYRLCSPSRGYPLIPRPFSGRFMRFLASRQIFKVCEPTKENACLLIHQRTGAQTGRVRTQQALVRA
jgi:hypothetical protein